MASVRTRINAEGPHTESVLHTAERVTGHNGPMDRIDDDSPAMSDSPGDSDERLT